MVEAIRNGNVETNTARGQAESITFASTFMSYDGYGGTSEYLARSMERNGANVQVVPLRPVDLTGLSTEFQTMLKRSRPDPYAVTLCYSWPLENMEPISRARDLMMYTMWETSRLPAGWAELINQAQAVIVPTRFVARVFRESGITSPIEVVPLGVDPVVYHYQIRPERPGVTTLTVGTFVTRKNIEIGIAAWKQAFQDDPDARLIIKTRFKARTYSPDDPRITFVDSEERTQGIAHFYQQADVLLALGNEGFGLPLVEGMASGLPVIVLNSEGQADMCEDANGCLLPVAPAQWEPFAEAPFGPSGVRGIPLVSDVVAQLRWVADHPKEARAIGQAASAWALKNRNIWASGPQLLDVLEQYARPSRPLRRSYMS